MIQKKVTKADLQFAVLKSPPNSEFFVNNVGNLSVVVGGERVGFIDFLDGELVLYSEENADDES